MRTYTDVEKRMVARQPWPITREEAQSAYRNEVIVNVMLTLQAALEPVMHSCPCCYHSGPIFSVGDHWPGCPFLDFLMSPEGTE